MKDKKPLQSSKGHRPGILDEHQQQAHKQKADSSATAGVNNRDEDASDPERTSGETSKGFDRDQEAVNLGLEDNDKLEHDR